ncbi:HXXEE motif-containing protein [Gemmatirosa kalamazoonensis]|uniref:HXXEE motif-containing protein n=1 Tax=Gemmatirosa kalamazoonensis TaxID=861299 RepID=W0RD19_9BACT|nr:HXXEE domain-containing protein [Gemmatirosa kalamazoonensis]AHG88195.1 HXXEE motif-containing protein [Gemmatirosa kalamazoonensis]
MNAAWLAVFAASLWAMRRRGRAASLGALGATFLALGGGVGNGVAHLALALRAGGYFPGLYTAALCLVAGAVLLARLRAITGVGVD